MLFARRLLFVVIVFLASSMLFVSFMALAQSAAEVPDLARDKLDKARQIVDAGSANKEMKPAPSTNTEDFSVAASASKMIQQLGILVGVLLIGAWAVKKWIIKEPPMIQRQIKILDRIAVDPRTRLTLVDVAGEKVLVGHASGTIALLGIGSVKKEGKDFDISLSEAIKE